MRRVLIGLSASAILLACAGKTLDVGSNQGGNPPTSGGTSAGGNSGTSPSTGGSGGTGSGATAGVGSGGMSGSLGAGSLPRFPEPDDCVVGEQLPIVGVWDGYVEGSSSPTDVFRVTIVGASEANGVCGSVVYGKGTPPPPATDPDTGYPPADTEYPPGGIAGAPGGWGPMPGFSYTMLNGAVSGNRVRFETSELELWEDWCLLQTPAEDGASSSCLPCCGQSRPEGCFVTDPQTGNETPVDCRKMALCTYGQVCECNRSECAAPVRATNDFDFHVEADAADGSVQRGGRRARMFRAP